MTGAGTGGLGTGGPGSVERGDPARLACGELAFLAACTAAARLDYEHPEGRWWREQASRLAGQLPVSALMLDTLPLHALKGALERFSHAVEHGRRLPTGERDPFEPVHRQGELREALTNALASLFHRALPVWARGEPPPWAHPEVPQADPAEAETEGAG